MVAGSRLSREQDYEKYHSAEDLTPHKRWVEQYLEHEASGAVLAAVFEAAKEGELQKVTKWLQTGQVDALYTSPAGEQVALLHMAAGYGQPEVARELLRRGASVDLPDSWGGTPLMNAAGYGHLAVLRVLLRHHSDPDQQCDRGSSSLMHAADQGHEACVQTLLRAGANTELRNKLGETASQVAKARQHHVLAAMIEQHARNYEAHTQAAAQAARELAAVRAQAVARRAQAAQAAQADANMVVLLAHLAKGQAARSKKSLAQRAAAARSQPSQAPAAAWAAAPAAPAAPPKKQAEVAPRPITGLRRRLQVSG